MDSRTLGTELFRFKFDVPYHGSKKNDKRAVRIGRFARIIQGKRSAEVRDFILATLKRWLREHPEHRQIKCDINAQFLIYFPHDEYFTKKGVRSKTILDLSNAVQIYEDCLQKVGIIENDGQICGLDGSDRLPSKDGKWSVEIVLTKKTTPPNLNI